ncbi:MAG: hypothetical protein J6N76_00990, partial [Lachnospiraceae bacterium]|nr:hypothetical protein [Lachnospiraceae bacterium]
MNVSELKKILTEYTEYIACIRTLSAVSLKNISDADSYAEVLKLDYVEIGNLGRKCRQILSQTIYPLLKRR